ncbi:TraR/DksA family transcriptional regulator [Streptomyces sp. NPDC088725]|uniref:TraR/DksA family transcriptional regulator n=1 Tax=Streptomyces sp. NPDC088725 TaxID=3365873 RepID=UPI00382D1394
MVAKKSAAKKTTADTSAAKSAARTTAKSGAPEDAPATPDTPAPAKKAAAKKAPASKPAAKKAAAAAEGAAQAAEQTGTRTVGAKTVGAKTTTGGGTEDAGAAVTAGTSPGELAVRPGEDPWTPEEVAEARAELEGEVARLTAEIASSEQALAGLMRDSGDGAGDDDADTGTKNITREHEMALSASAREVLEQTERALHRLDAGTYGLCEICGKPIGKARMQAFPRATLCVEDKQKQERRG